jgi:ABC-type branched-subunit amino acid transport system ATPase component
MTLLSVDVVAKRFLGNAVLNGVSFDLQKGESVGLIGPNGAGKTTLVNIITGFIQPDGGRVLLNGKRLDGLKPYQVSLRGVRRTFQLTRNFPHLSVLENLLVAAEASGITRGVAEERAEPLLEDLTLARLAMDPADMLSGGQQKLLELAACFIVEPKLVVLDEPFAAIHPAIKDIINAYVTERHDQGQTFLIVSHDIPAFYGLTERLVAMGEGRVLADGPIEDVLSESFVVDAFLGGEAWTAQE